ncbi:MAG: acylneuraminate cytidylyltransferase family protein [Acidobacteria bacterium]|nr:acylneuraminate cytidylyltransferase family protein [Acidobacteriota bacterium]
MNDAIGRVLGLIPARSGSKGVPRKNLKLLWGKPLLEYTAEAAHASSRLSRVILSTEDEEIAEAGRRCGLEVPFLRPVELARDKTPMLPVAQHALRTLEAEGDTFDALCLLQPTNPLRRPEDIDQCIELLGRNDVDAVVTVLPVPDEYNPHWVYFSDADGLLRLSTGESTPISRRQELPPALHRDGSVYVTRRNVLMEENSFYGSRLIGYRMDPERSVNIDSLEDWERAVVMLERIRNKRKEEIKRQKAKGKRQK